MKIHHRTAMRVPVLASLALASLGGCATAPPVHPVFVPPHRPAPDPESMVIGNGIPRNCLDDVPQGLTACTTIDLSATITRGFQLFRAQQDLANPWDIPAIEGILGARLECSEQFKDFAQTEEMRAGLAKFACAPGAPGAAGGMLHHVGYHLPAARQASLNWDMMLQFAPREDSDPGAITARQMMVLTTRWNGRCPSLAEIAPFLRPGDIAPQAHPAPMNAFNLDHNRWQLAAQAKIEVAMTALQMLNTCTITFSANNFTTGR